MDTTAQAARDEHTHAAPRSPLVSIVVVNFNGAVFLGDCLDSVAALEFKDYELILVDNGSSDDSLNVIARYPWVKLVRSETNLGIAGGNNLGLCQCAGRHILLLNSDTIVAAGFLAPLSNYLNFHPAVAVVQGKMVLPRRGGRLDVCGSFLTWLGLPYHYGYFKPDGPKYRRNFPIFSGKGACLMFRREIIDDVGGFLFDDDFFCYYEDSDFCHRAWLAGYEVHFVSSPPVQHLMGATAGGPQSAFVLRHYLRNMAFSLWGNLSPLSRPVIMPLFLAVNLAALLVAAARRQWPQAAAHWAALACGWRDRKRIRVRRRLISQIRRKSDRAIFRKVLRMPRLDYFLKTLAGKLDAYVDDGSGSIDPPRAEDRR